MMEPKKRWLHIGGYVRNPQWENFNIIPSPTVDHIGDAVDLSRFADHCFEKVYASHILEHLSLASEVERALSEWHRVLAPQGVLYVAVPDLDQLMALWADTTKRYRDHFHTMRMIYGGHIDAHDYHRSGWNFDFLSAFLKNTGFSQIERVHQFGYFDDTSELDFEGIPISLNIIARKF